jgi:hypothetical protein
MCLTAQFICFCCGGVPLGCGSLACTPNRLCRGCLIFLCPASPHSFHLLPLSPQPSLAQLSPPSSAQSSPAQHSPVHPAQSLLLGMHKHLFRHLPKIYLGSDQLSPAPLNLLSRNSRQSVSAFAKIDLGSAQPSSAWSTTSKTSKRPQMVPRQDNTAQYLSRSGQRSIRFSPKQTWARFGPASPDKDC